MSASFPSAEQPSSTRIFADAISSAEKSLSDLTTSAGKSLSDLKTSAEKSFSDLKTSLPRPRMPELRRPRIRERVAYAIVSLGRWFDSSVASHRFSATDEHKIDWVRIIPFIGLHLMVLGVFFVGVSPIALAVCAAMYFVRMFAVTGFYHRYFSHRTFKCNRFWQFIFALWGSSAVQRGPMWWAAHHRDHHRHSDGEEDVHSPHRHGFWWSHVGWITSKSNYHTKVKAVPDLAKYPEIRFLDRYETFVPALTGLTIFLLGMFLNRWWPSLGTSGMQMLIWGFFVSTVILAHATFTINSLAHLFGNKRYRSKDESRNNFWLALLTLGEGWHNNHHYYPGAVRQGFYWWEIDITYYGLWIMSKLGIIHDLNPVPHRIRESNHLTGT